MRIVKDDAMENQLKNGVIEFIQIMGGLRILYRRRI